jgi:CHC2-type zinc finger protein
MSTWIDFKELRSKLRFSDVFRHYAVQVTVKGERATGFCPLPTHQGQRRSPSFSVHLERGIWQCFGCQAKGNLLDFACRMEGCRGTCAVTTARSSLRRRSARGLRAPRSRRCTSSQAVRGRTVTRKASTASCAMNCSTWRSSPTCPKRERWGRHGDWTTTIAVHTRRWAIRRPRCSRGSVKARSAEYRRRLRASPPRKTP